VKTTQKIVESLPVSFRTPRSNIIVSARDLQDNKYEANNGFSARRKMTSGNRSASVAVI